MSGRDYAALFLSFALLLLFVRAPRRELRSEGLSLLRSLFPAWRFFEEIAEIPVLSHRVIAQDAAPGPWRCTLHAPARSAGMLFLYAAGNLHLAQQSLVEHLLALRQEQPGGDDLSSTTSYRLVQALVLQQIRNEHPEVTGQYQFRLCERGQPDDVPPLLLSQSHTL